MTTHSEPLKNIVPRKKPPTPYSCLVMYRDEVCVIAENFTILVYGPLASAYIEAFKQFYEEHDNVDGSDIISMCVTRAEVRWQHVAK